VHREIPVDRFPLWHVTHATQRAVCRLAKDFHPTANRWHDAHHGFDERRFAGAIWAHHAHQPAGRHREVHTVEHRPLMIGDSEVVRFERGRHGANQNRMLSPTKGVKSSAARVSPVLSPASSWMSSLIA